jgi:hydroxymethylbilane synthase
MSLLRIGTRGSPLALWQANHAAALLRAAEPTIAIELIEIETTGDQVRDVPLAQLGGDGVFTKAIQHALQEKRVDVAVHSLKDLPTFAVDNLMLAAVPLRGPVGDAFISGRWRTLGDLPQGAVVASSSLRRRAQLLHRRPDINVVDIRGNVETRIRKLFESNLDGLLLAQAGLERLGLQKHITEVLDTSWMLPAVGQGALGLECRTDDKTTRRLLEKIDEPRSHARVAAERALLRGLGGGCQVPIGADTMVMGETLVLKGVVLTRDGQTRILGEIGGALNEAELLGSALANDLLGRGAREILASV